MAQLKREQADLVVLWERRPHDAEVALVQLFGSSGGVAEEAGGYSMGFLPFTWAETMRPHLDTPRKGTPMPGATWTEKIIRHSLNVGDLRGLEFELAQGVSIVAADINPDELLKPYVFDGHQPLLLASGQWMAWTKLPLGRVPREPYDQWPEAKEAILAELEGTTIQSMAAARGIDGSSMEFLTYRQDFKKYARGLDDGLTAMPADKLLSLQALTDMIVEAPAKVAGGAHVLPASNVEKWSKHPEPHEAAQRLLIGSPDCQFPFLARHGDGLYYAREALRGLSMACVAVGTSPGRPPMSDRAGIAFEQLVSILLSEQGYVGPNGPPLVGHHFTKSGGDIDVFCWDTSDILIVECKYEMQPPGAWSTTNVTRRTADLKIRLGQLDKKRDDCERAFAEGRLHMTNAAKDAVKLRSDLLAGRRIRTVLISGRMEPAVHSGTHEAYSMLPSYFASELRARFEGLPLMSFWDAPGPLPAPPSKNPSA